MRPSLRATEFAPRRTPAARAARSTQPQAPQPHRARPTRVWREIRRVCARRLQSITILRIVPPGRQVVRCVPMGVLSRIGVAIDSDLLKKFDRLITQRGYTNRSEAFRDLIRDELVE